MSSPRISPFLRLAVLACAIPLDGCREQPYRHYPTHAQAIAAGEAARGWLPSWVPSSANEIHIQGDLDTNHFWLRFSLPPAAASTLKVRLIPVPPAQLSTVPLTRPSSAPWWFEALIELEPSDDGALNADLFQGRGDEVARTTFLAFDRTTSQVFVWGKDRQPPVPSTPPA